ncbi:hypothetical protein ACFX12_034425 [Malus domestica]
MRIAELSTPELRQGHSNSQPPSQSHQLLISQIESSIKQIENLSPEKLSPDTVSADLRQFSTNPPNPTWIESKGTPLSAVAVEGEQEPEKVELEIKE